MIYFPFLNAYLYYLFLALSYLLRYSRGYKHFLSCIFSKKLRNRVRAMLDMFRYVSTCCQTIEYIPPLQFNSIIEIGARGVTLVSIIIVLRRVVFP